MLTLHLCMYRMKEWMGFRGVRNVLEHSNHGPLIWRRTWLLHSWDFIDEDLLRSLLSLCLVTCNASQKYLPAGKSCKISLFVQAGCLPLLYGFVFLLLSTCLLISPLVETGFLRLHVQVNLSLLSHRVSLVSLAGILSPLSEWDLGAAKREINLFLIWLLPFL